MIIALTGVIGAGKTTVANMFKNLGANIIDADRIGHDLLDKTEIKDKLVGVIKKDITEKGKLSREKLGKVVFNDYKELEKLDKIVHPLIIKEIKKKIKKNRINIIDAALYGELRLKDIADKIILVKASKKNIIDRSRFTKNYIEKIIKSQKQLKKADFVITNNKTKAELRKEVAGIWKKLK